MCVHVCVSVMERTIFFANSEKLRTTVADHTHTKRSTPLNRSWSCFHKGTASIIIIRDSNCTIINEVEGSCFMPFFYDHSSAAKSGKEIISDVRSWQK